MDAREKKKKKPDKKTFEDAMQDIDSWTKSLETTKKSNSRTGSSDEPRSKKPILVEFKKDIQTGNYKWKNPGKVYKRRKIQVNEAASAGKCKIYVAIVGTMNRSFSLLQLHHNRIE